MTWQSFFNFIVGDKEGKSRVRSQGWHELNHTWYNIRVCKRLGVSCKCRYLFNITWYWAVLGFGVYISEHLWNISSRETPPGDELSMMNGGPYFILIQGGLLVFCCHPSTLQMVKIWSIGVEFLMMTAIRTTGHTCGW